MRRAVGSSGDVSSGGYFLIFWMFQNPPDLLFSLIKGMTMATAIVMVGCYYGYTASGGPVGVGTATSVGRVGAILSSYAGAWALDLGGNQSFFTLVAAAMLAVFISLALVRRHIPGALGADSAHRAAAAG